jgi:hypothetical protein
MASFAWHVPAFLGPVLGGLALAAVLAGGPARRITAEAACLIAVPALGWILSNSYGSDMGRYALLVLAPLCSAAASAATRALRHPPLPALLVALLFVHSWEGLRLRLYPQQPRDPAVLARAAAQAPPGVLLVSFPDWLAWRTDRLGAWLPRDFETLSRLRDRIPVGAILLTPDLFFMEDPRRRDDLLFWGQFREAYQGRISIPGFHKARDLGDGSQLWLPDKENAK